MKKILFFLSIFVFAITCSLANATNITLYKSKDNNNDVPINKIDQLINETVSVNLYRQVKAQVIYSKVGKPEHVLVFLFARQHHSFKVSRININSDYGFVSFIQDYQLTSEDIAQRPGMPSSIACPNPSIQFISIAPNDPDPPYRNDQKYAIEADKAAKAKGLHTVLLLGKDATSANWLNYMSCPKLEGNFYDGDGAPSSVTTRNGYLTNKDFSTTLKGKFRLKVTNIWVACEAYKDPMKSAIINDAQAQKYAAGINDLWYGPSDKAAVCTMKDALNGSKISTSFSECYKQYDRPGDKWGLGGNGSDYFGK